VKKKVFHFNFNELKFGLGGWKVVKSRLELLGQKLVGLSYLIVTH
jgi:hypothetical protein